MRDEGVEVELVIGWLLVCCLFGFGFPAEHLSSDEFYFKLALV